MSSKRRKGRAVPAELPPETEPGEAVEAAVPEAGLAGSPEPDPGSSQEPHGSQDEAGEPAVEADEAPAAGEEVAAEAVAGEPGAAPARRRRVQHPPPPPERLAGAVEALLLASGDALTPERMRDVLGLSSAIHVREALDQVRQRWAEAGLSVELQEVAGGVRVVTRPEYAEYVRRLARHVVDGKLSQGQLETLSIVAYRQPVARPEIERIRGVQVGEALRALLERNLVKVVGRSDQPGRPMLYGTTKKFLTTFGLNDLKDLPSAKDLARL